MARSCAGAELPDPIPPCLSQPNPTSIKCDRPDLLELGKACIEARVLTQRRVSASVIWLHARPMPPGSFAGVRWLCSVTKGVTVYPTLRAPFLARAYHRLAHNTKACTTIHCNESRAILILCPDHVKFSSGPHHQILPLERRGHSGN